VLLFSPGDAVVHARLRGDKSWPGVIEGWASLERYALGAVCRQQAVREHFMGERGAACGGCDVCLDRPGVLHAVSQVLEKRAQTVKERRDQRRADAAIPVSSEAEAQIVAFVDAMRRPCGKRLVAQGLRGSRAKPVRRRGLPNNPHFGALAVLPEVAVIQAIERLLAEERLAPRGKKYPTVWIPGKPIRRAPVEGAKPKYKPTSSLESTLRELRRREARKRRWRAYQVFDNRTLSAIADLRPTTLEELATVRGLGERRVARFGERILAAVREAASG
jgi:ATP-dependent DNA helicase RecQ